MARLPALTPSLAAGVLAGAGVAGVVFGSVANLVLSRYLIIPEAGEMPTYEDAPPPELGDSAPLVAGGRPGESRPGRLARKGGGDKRSFVTAIAERNIFDSAAVKSVSDGPQETGCKESKMGLLATVVADEPAYSSALIGGSGPGRAFGYKVGDNVPGEGTIVTIDQKRVCIEDGGCLCMGDEARRSVGPDVAAEDETDSGGVTKVSDTKFLVDKSFVEKQLANVEALATQIRAVPKTENGAIVGFRLSAIRKGSAFDKLGIKNGDVLHAANGTTLTSTEAALAAYQALGSESAFNFEITRKNQKMTIEYEVR